MSSIVTEFNPATSTTTEFAAPNSAANGALVFWNESNISLTLTFADGDIKYLPAWYVRKKCGATGSVNITWDQHTVLSQGDPPTSEIIVEAYASGEPTPPEGALVRQTNGSVAVSNATSVTNTGFSPGNTFIFATPVGETQGDVIITNNGQVQLGNNVDAGQIVVTSGATAGLGFIQGNLIESTAAGGGFSALNGLSIVIQNALAASVFSADGLGNVTLAGALKLAVGSISRIALSGPFTVATAGTTCAHDLGVTPDFLIGLNDTASSPACYGFNMSTIGSVNVAVTSSVNNSRCFILAIKF